MTRTYKKKDSLPKEKRICRYCLHSERILGEEDYVYCSHVKGNKKYRQCFDLDHGCSKFGVDWKAENKIAADRLMGKRYARSAR